MEKETYGWVLVGAIALLLAGSMLMGTGHMGFSMGIGPFFMIIFWIAVIWLVFELIQKSGKKDSMEILKERYAKGEIGRKQFEKMKKELL